MFGCLRLLYGAANWRDFRAGGRRAGHRRAAAKSQRKTTRIPLVESGQGLTLARTYARSPWLYNMIDRPNRTGNETGDTSFKTKPKSILPLDVESRTTAPASGTQLSNRGGERKRERERDSFCVSQRMRYAQARLFRESAASREREKERAPSLQFARGPPTTDAGDGRTDGRDSKRISRRGANCAREVLDTGAVE